MGVLRPVAIVRSGFRRGSWGWNVRAHEPPNRLLKKDCRKLFFARAVQLYPRTFKNSSADLRGSRNKSDITATESAPASMIDRALERVMPPIATRGLLVSSLARRTPSSPTVESGFTLLLVSKTGPMAR